MGLDKKYGNVTVENDSVKNPLNDSEEPVFVIRAQDSLAAAVLARYEMQAQMVEQDWPEREDVLERAREAHGAFEQWRAENPDKVKLPT